MKPALLNHETRIPYHEALNLVPGDRVTLMHYHPRWNGRGLEPVGQVHGVYKRTTSLPVEFPGDVRRFVTVELQVV